MKNRFLVFLFHFLSLNGSGQTALQRIDSLMNHFYKPSQPGAVIAIRLHQKTIFKKGYGLADLATGKTYYRR